MDHVVDRHAFLKVISFVPMKFPTPLILQTSSSLLLPNPLILKDVFGVDFDSTEGLLRWFHKVTESDVPSTLVHIKKQQR